MTYIVTAPADTGSNILTENGKIRDNWTSLTNTIAVDHDTMDTTRDGQHKQVTLFELAADPNAGVQVANTGFLYTKDDGSGNTEAFFMDGAATPNILRMTSGGKLYTPGNNAPLGSAVAWGTVNSSGIIQGSAYNLTCDGVVAFVFVFKFGGELLASGMSDTNYCVVMTLESSGSVSSIPTVGSKGTDGFIINSSSIVGMSVVVYGTAA